MTIISALTNAEIFALGVGDLTVGDMYIPTDIDPKVAFKVSASKQIVEYENVRPVFIENPIKSDADRLTENKGWFKANPVNNDHVDIYDGLGIKFGGIENPGANISRPVYFIPFDGEMMTLQYYQQPKTFDNEGSLTGTIGVTYENPNSGNDGINRLSGGAYDSATGKLALVSYGYHVVRVYDKQPDDSWVLLYTIGAYSNGSSTAFESGGKLSRPRDAVWMPNGNLAVSCSNGRYAASDYSNGYIAEFDGSTGAAIGAIMTRPTSASSSSIGNSVARSPMSLEPDPLDSNMMYVNEYSGYKILKVNLTTHTIVQEYFGIDGQSASGCQAIGIIDDGRTLLRTNSSGILMAQATSNGDALWVKNAKNGELSADHSGNWTYGNFAQITRDRFVMTDFNNNRALFDSEVSNVEIDYLIPYTEAEYTAITNDFSVNAAWGIPSNTNIDLGALKLTVPLSRVPEVGPILLELGRR